MTAARRGTARRRRLRSEFTVALAAMWAATAVPAAAVAAVPGAAAAARDALRFQLVPAAGSAAELLDIAATNGRVVLAIALGAWSASRLPALRPVVDLVAATVVLANAALVGIAAGAYGTRAMPWLVHLPLEWAAIALVAGLHRLGRAQPLAAIPAVKAATAALLLVGLGALSRPISPRRRDRRS